MDDFMVIILKMYTLTLAYNALSILGLILGVSALIYISDRCIKGKGKKLTPHKPEEKIKRDD